MCQQLREKPFYIKSISYNSTGWVQLPSSKRSLKNFDFFSENFETEMLKGDTGLWKEGTGRQTLVTQN